MAMEKADLLIVGGGPVGAYAAWRFAERGLRVVVIEKEPETAESPIGVFHFERVAFDRTGIPLPTKEQTVCVYPGATIHSPDQRHAVTVDGVETYALDLTQFIASLRRAAKKAGAKFRYKEQVVDVVRSGRRIGGVRTKAARAEKEYSATVVVDASGLARTVRHHVPVMRYPGDDEIFSVYMEYWAAPHPAPEPGLHSYLGHNAWTAQYPEYWIAGIGQPLVFGPAKKAHAAFFGRQFPGDKSITKAVSGAIPWAYPPPTLVEDGVLALGDAAATNKPFNGEGIASSMAVVKIAAEVLPDAVANGGSRDALWEINRRYFAGQGGKFAFLRAMAAALIDMTPADINTAFEIGLIKADDLRQTFLDYEIVRPLTAWVGPIGKLMLRTRLAAKYGKAIFAAGKVARLYAQYPESAAFPAWQRRFMELIAVDKTS